MQMKNWERWLGGACIGASSVALAKGDSGFVMIMDIIMLVIWGVVLIIDLLKLREE